MPLNKITKTALEALGETINQMVLDDDAKPQQVRDFLECLCFIMDDGNVVEAAGDASVAFPLAKWYIRRWLKKQKEG